MAIYPAQYIKRAHCQVYNRIILCYSKRGLTAQLLAEGLYYALLLSTADGQSPLVCGHSNWGTITFK